MAIKDKETYEAWKQEILGKVTDDQRQALGSVLGSPVGEEFFGGYLREKDYYTRLNRLAEEKAEKAEELNRMHQWYQQAKPQYDEMAARAAQAEKQKADLEEKFRSIGLSEGEASQRASQKYDQEIEQLKRQLQFVDQAAPALTTKMAKMAFKAFKEGYDFDPDAILATAQRHGVPLEQAFDLTTEQVRREREAKRQQEALDAAREAGRKEALTNMGTPDAPRPRGKYSSPLFSHLDTKPGNPSMALRDEAVKAFYELQQ